MSRNLFDDILIAQGVKGPKLWPDSMDDDDGVVPRQGILGDSTIANLIMLRDGYGNLIGHVHSGTVDGLKPGATVSAGDQIGFYDASGLPTTNKAHLHLTFRRGTPEFPATMRTPYSDPEAILQKYKYEVKDRWPNI